MSTNTGGDIRDSSVGFPEKSLRILTKLVSEPYYLLHVLVFFSYFAVRLAAYRVLSPYRSSIVLRREIQALVAFCALTCVKAVREESWETFIQNTLLHAKDISGLTSVAGIPSLFCLFVLSFINGYGLFEIFLAFIALVMDYHLALWYAIVFLVIYVSTQHPPHERLGTLNLLTPLMLESLLTEGSTSRFWLVEFRALSTSSSVGTSSFFPELSITYSNKNLSFGVIDLGLFPNAAEKFGIPLVSLSQLPVYILFENGTEASRFPDVEVDVKIFSTHLTKKLICRHFELDKLLIDYVNGK